MGGEDDRIETKIKVKRREVKCIRNRCGCQVLIEMQIRNRVHCY